MRCDHHQRRHLPARRIRAELLRTCPRNQRRFPLLITRPHPLRRRSHAPCPRRALSWTTGSMKQSVEGATRARPLNHLLSGSSPPNPSGVAADPLLSEARVKAGELKNSKVARFSAASLTCPFFLYQVRRNISTLVSKGASPMGFDPYASELILPWAA